MATDKQLQGIRPACVGIEDAAAPLVSSSSGAWLTDESECMKRLAGAGRRNIISINLTQKELV